MAGPSGADPAVRHYSHDAWNSVSATLQLPAKGAVDGRAGAGPDPRRAGGAAQLLVAFPILAQSVADRRTANSEWAADLGEELRQRSRRQAAGPAPQRGRARPAASTPNWPAATP